MIFQAGIAVRLQYCDNWQSDIHNAIKYEHICLLILILKCKKVAIKR